MLEVIAPFKHFNKLREFVQMKLPPGFPVKLGMCVCVDLPLCSCVCVCVSLRGTFKTKNALSFSPSQTSPFSPRSQQLSHFRNSAMTNLRSLFSSFLTNTKKIPAASLTSDLCTHLAQTGNDQRAKMFGRWETKMRNPVVFYSHVYHSFKKKKKKCGELIFLISYCSFC